MQWTPFAAAALVAILVPWHPDTVTAALRDLDRYEGGRVQTDGVVTSLRPFGDGWRLGLERDGWAVPVLLPRLHGAPPGPGAWLDVEGRVDRFDGELVLRADRFAVTPPPPPEPVPLAALAARPDAWDGRMVQVTGRVTGTTLSSDGVHLTLEPAPEGEGLAILDGLLHYDATCMCHSLQVTGIRWTS